MVGHMENTIFNVSLKITMCGLCTHFCVLLINAMLRSSQNHDTQEYTYMLFLVHFVHVSIDQMKWVSRLVWADPVASLIIC